MPHAAPVYSLNAVMLAGSEQWEGDKLWAQGAGEGEVGAISLLVTDSSMQTTSPQGRNQEAGPLTQAEEEGGGSAQQCKLWPYEEYSGGAVSAGQTGQTDRLASSGLLKMSS